ncbi:MAG TPA: LPS-assembly protein LptD, partial [Candidatus Paraprevotella stercorigallinarum]|nr:LPS-assembly protein LptD [Candidatus Paraprevotella stercorigallinarum]
VIADSIKVGVLVADSLATDSVAADSVKSKSALDQPVEYTAKDSVTFEAGMGNANLYGESKVNYQNLELTADLITMNMDSSIVHAVGRMDSTGQMKGQPVFKQGSDEYEPEKISYNFKTRKAFIDNVYTPQGNGFMISQESKRDGEGVMYVRHGKYTTCNARHPHFYLALTRAKVRPGKDVVFGPAYLVVEDVPLPLAIPYGFFPFSKKYSSGFIMPTFGDESVRGFYLRDGGYYFAINDMIDLKLIGEIYTKGSWGLSAQSNYNKRYRFSGNFFLSYQNTVEGEKNMPDYAKSTSFKVQWTHRQDAKANPTQSFSASVNFATSNYERNNLTSMYNPENYTQSTRTSSVSYQKTFSDIGLTLSGSFNLSQNMRDSSLSMTLPSLDISLARFYPFKRKKMAGEERWYEKIALSYTGSISNSINTKEDQLLKSNLIKDWRNGMRHSIPISATFNLFNYINISPQFNFTDRMYTHKVMKHWDQEKQKEVNDTVWGFQNVYNYDMSVSATTKLYGFYTPLFGKKIQTIRHVFTPTVSFNYAPDFGAQRFGYYTSYVKTDAEGNVSTVNYSPYSGSLYGVPGQGKTGSISMDIANNIEMKIRTDNDSLKKISLIDELGASLSYNMAAESKPWSDLSMRVRIKTPWNYTFSMNAVFATYAYQFDENGKVYVGDRTEWSYGRFGRFQGMSQNLSYTFSNETFKKLFGWGKSEDKQGSGDTDDASDNTANEVGDTNVDPDLKKSQQPAGEPSGQDAEVDEDGYLKFKLPWSFTVSYGVTMAENTSAQIKVKRMRYPYKLTHTLNFSGNIRISDGWNLSYSSGYDFNYHRLSMTTASISRDLHCFSMSASVVLSPYTSYNFTFQANASELADVLRWKKQSSYSSNIEWY